MNQQDCRLSHSSPIELLLVRISYTILYLQSATDQAACHRHSVGDSSALCCQLPVLILTPSHAQCNIEKNRYHFLVEQQTECALSEIFNN